MRRKRGEGRGEEGGGERRAREGKGGEEGEEGRREQCFLVHLQWTAQSL